MSFNSVAYLAFLPTVFALYWGIGRFGIKAQNALVLAASYFFYAWWDWRFLGLIIFSTAVDYCAGIWLEKTEESWARKLLLGISVGVNLSLLATFKYLDFFLGSLATALQTAGIDSQPRALNLVLPIGISFYTFQTLSYTIDVYRGGLKPMRDPIAFAGFVAFFPQLIAGPIERAKNLLPQFTRQRRFDPTAAVDGLRQILWGLVKKLLVADNCAAVVDQVFAQSHLYSTGVLWLAAVLYAFQLYCDFSGYSDVALGTSRLFGFRLRKNFAVPYFSRDVGEFWRRWHISLSAWFRDYLYLPLGGNRGTPAKKVRNIFILFVAIGMWHGAHLKFAVFGAVHALLMVPIILASRRPRRSPTVAARTNLPSVTELAQMLWTFAQIALVGILFRADDLGAGFRYLARMFSRSAEGLEAPEVLGRALILLLGFVVVEWVGRKQEHPLEHFALSWPRAARWAFYCSLLSLLGGFMRDQHETFIYFQF